MAVTLTDVAKRAGVSLTTASRVINNDDIHRVNPKTTKKVLAAAMELEYAPNEFARKLRQKKPSGAGLLNIGVLLTSAIDSYNDSFFYDILLGIQAEIADLGHSLSFAYSFNDTSPAAIQSAITTTPISGLIILGRMNADTLHLLQKNHRHIVYAGLNPVNHQFDEVVCDGFLCAKTAVKHLAENGRKRIAFVGTASLSGSSMLLNEYRYDGYLSAMKELDLPVKKEYIIDTPLNIEMAFQSVDQMLSRGDIPDGLFCANDYCAIGALKALRLHKLKVPQDVATVSIDDIDMAAYSRPMLSTIQIPRQEIGKYSVKLLIDQIQNHRKYPIRISMPFRLIVRESCGGDPQKQHPCML
jgi:DNA-binding LacI/PurR family transcriptional regulator